VVNVLDIDLDFFLKPRPTRREKDGRPSASEYQPWSPAEVEAYLTKRCNLRKRYRLPGAVVTYHHQVFDRWKSLIHSGHLQVPFHLTHIDSHADMGMGDGSAGYIQGELLHCDPTKRHDPKRGDVDGLLEGNFISFAVACRWIERITYVTHPALRQENVGKLDIPDCLFRNNDPDGGVIQLKKLPTECRNAVRRLTTWPALALEPEVPLDSKDCNSFFTRAPFSFVFAAQSPNYTPASADCILDTISQFIDDQESASS
jgi:hypothetical protein